MLQSSKETTVVSQGCPKFIGSPVTCDNQIDNNLIFYNNLTQVLLVYQNFNIMSNIWILTQEFVFDSVIVHL